MFTEDMLKVNTKFIGNYPIKNTDLDIPIAIINGKYLGKTLLITAGIHGSEYHGIEAAQRLIQMLKPEEIYGRVIILPCVNVSAFFERSAFVNPNDNKNLNRCFPGNRNGTETEKIAYTIAQEFISLADIYLDLHSGDSPEELIPLVFASQVGPLETTRQILDASQYLDLNYVVASNSKNSTCGCAALSGVPALLIERGGLAERNEVDISGFIKDILNLMNYLEIMKGNPIIYQQQFLTNIIYQDSPLEGLWYPQHKAGDKVEKGDLLGEIRDFSGSTICQCHAQQDGIILYQWVLLPITKDMPLIAYGN